MDHYTEGKHHVGTLTIFCIILWFIAYFLGNSTPYTVISAVFSGLASALTLITVLQACIELFTDHELN